MTGATNAGQGQPKRPPMVGGYELISKLGQGAVGTVYKARQVSAGRIVALKVLDTRYARDKKYVARFLREARAVGNLNHVNIVEGIDVGRSHEGYYYFAMEYVEGETVKHLLRRERVVAEARAIDIASQIAQALRHASRIKLVHRDIKPENIMLTKEGVAKLADLGLAKSSVEDPSLTTVGQAMGTALYISPEQATGRPDVDVRSDIYSLGATLYHVVTGFPPFAGENPTVIILKHINESPPSPREVNPSLSQDLCHVIEKMIAKDRAERYQTATELVDDLAALAVGKPPVLAREYSRRRMMKAPSPRRPGPVKQSARFAGVFTAGVFVLAAAAGLYFGFFNAPPPTPEIDGKTLVAGDTDNDQTEATRKAKREKEAEQFLSQARNLEESDPAGAQTIYERVAADFPDTTAGAAAPDHIESLKQKIAQESADARRLEADDAAWQEVLKKVEAARGDEAYGEAIKLVKVFDPDSRHEKIKQRANELLKTLRDEFRKMAEKMRAGAQALKDAGRYDEALAAFVKLSKLDSEVYGKWGTDGIAAVEAALRAQAEEARKLHAAFWVEFACTLRQDGMEAARTYAEDAVRNPELAAAKQEIEWDLELLNHLRQMERDARAGLKSLEGSTFALGGDTPLLISDVTETEFKKAVSGVPVTCKIKDLSPADRFRLAEHFWESERQQCAAPRAAYYLCLAQDLDAARAALVGLPAEDGRKFIARIEALVPEVEAGELLARLAAADKEDRWEDALETCGRLNEQYGQTALVRRAKQTIERLQEKAELRRFVVIIPRKFKGDVELRKDGRWQFHWDFSSADQLVDFERDQVPERYRRQAQQPRVSGGGLFLKGIAVVVPAVFKGVPLTVEYRLRLLTEKARYGYGRIFIFGRGQPRKSLWEFAYCHGNRARNEPDFFRNSYTLGRTPNDCWRRECPAGTLERKTWHKVKAEITAGSAKAWFDGRQVYDSGRVELPNGGVDPSACPDLSTSYQIQFSGWEPADTWVFDDITIIAPVDSAWLRAAVEE